MNQPDQSSVTEAAPWVSSHASGGETSSSSQVYFEGICSFCLNAGELRVIAIAALPHRIIRTVAKRMTASLES